jgi:hypothetical protein
MTTQLDSSVGFKKESTFGTGVTVDRFLEYTEESFDFARTFYQGSGLRPGSRLPRSGRRVLVKDGAEGDISLEVPTRGIGTLLELLMGVASSTLIPTTTAYQQVFTPIKNDFLPTATIQKGVPRLGQNTVDAYTMRGMVCSDFEFSASNSEVLKLKTAWVGKEIDTTIAYATPSYPAGLELFSFVGAALTVGGTVTLPTTTALATGGTAVANVRDFTCSWDNGLDSNGYNLGGAGKLTRPPAVGAAVGKGKMTAEYDSLAFRDAVRDQTDLAIVATFQGPTIIAGTTIYPTLQIVIPNIRLEGELPKSNGGDVITQSLDFTMLDNLTAASPFYVVTRTADTAL